MHISETMRKAEGEVTDLLAWRLPSFAHGPLNFDRAKRCADVLCACIALIIGVPLFAAISLLICFTSPGPVLFWSVRYGRHNVPFRMPKFRTMRSGTPEVPTLALPSPQNHITPVGRLLRLGSLDELPQLWSILIGDMSLIGPRPVICAESELAARRAGLGVHCLLPGITGWAQIHGRDTVSLEEKALLDKHYLDCRSVRMDLYILSRTITRVLSRDGITY
ncbi:MAG: sugar transferase [Acidobacteriaceae bacterium]